MLSTLVSCPRPWRSILAAQPSKSLGIFRHYAHIRTYILYVLKVYIQSIVLDIEITYVYNTLVRQERKFFLKGSEGMDEMTTAELNQYLENIAKLIEATAKDPESAAKLVRDSKIKA